ncbi:MAG: glycosyltransferase family 4 protein [Coriobacteriia bacterium]|nr:glycosyltransferase family 4 protein [Coriobacteriia bacterium]
MQKVGGISRYVAEVTHALKGRSGIEPGVPVRYADNRYLVEVLNIRPHTLFHRYRGRGCRYVMSFGDYFNKKLALRALETISEPVYHPTYYDPYLLPHLNQTPFVITVHDMIHELFPDEVADPWVALHKAVMIEQADHIIAVSESTKRDLLQFYPESAGKVTVIHHGASFMRRENNIEPLVSGPYLLFVGSRGAYKNFKMTVEAYVQLGGEHPDLSLVCAGGGIFTQDEQYMLDARGISSRVYQISATDTQLESLYAHAAAFVFPSHYEGFGLPILEAMACGAPCALSNTSSLPEVGGDAACYFDPCDADAQARILADILSDNTLASDMRHAGFKRAASFTWEKSARQHEEVYLAL